MQTFHAGKRSFHGRSAELTIYFIQLKEIGMTEASFARQIGASGSTVNDWKNKKTESGF